MTSAPPVITIDGPAATGKGTVAKGVAQALGFHYLDSGALYRLVALVALRRGLSQVEEGPLSVAAHAMNVVFDGEIIRLDGQEVTAALREEAVGAVASRIAILPRLRAALVSRQRAFRTAPGLVAEGRDMGTVIFPDAGLKVFVTASLDERAKRRYNQLIEKGNSVTLDGLLRDIRERDARDSTRATAPLRRAVDAVDLDTTNMTIDAAIAFVLEQFRAVAAAERR
jgi:cytidylate kinase